MLLILECSCCPVCKNNTRERYKALPPPTPYPPIEYLSLNVLRVFNAPLPPPHATRRRDWHGLLLSSHPKVVGSFGRAWNGGESDDDDDDEDDEDDEDEDEGWGNEGADPRVLNGTLGVGRRLSSDGDSVSGGENTSAPQQPPEQQQQPELELPPPQQPEPEPQQPNPEPQQPDPEPQQPDLEPQQPDAEPQQPDAEPQQPDLEPQQPDLEPQQQSQEQQNQEVG